MVYASVIVSSRTNVQELSYSVPAAIIPYIRPGITVKVPLRQKMVVGVVVHLSRKIAPELKNKIRDIISIEKTNLGFTTGQIKTIHDLADYAGASLAEVGYHALRWPARLPEAAARRPSRPIFIRSPWAKRRQAYVDICSRDTNKSIVIVFSSNQYLESFVSLAKPKLGDRLLVLDDRAAATNELKKGELHQAKKVVVSLQAGVFLPLGSGDVLIIDSPDQVGLKQQRRPYLTAKRIALVRAQNESLRVIFGADLASVSDFLQKVNRHWQFLETTLPPISMTIHQRRGVRSPITPSAVTALAEKISEKAKILIVAASKYWSAVLYCPECQEIVVCPKCARPISLTSSEQLACTYCGATVAVPKVCPSCRRGQPIALGEGAAQLYTKLKSSTQQPIHLVSSATDQFPAEQGITVATEKIINFPDVSFDYALVANMDRLLAGTNPDGAWQLLQLLLFLRSSTKQIDIQTQFPDHWVWSAAATGQLNGYYRAELEQRRRYHLPPYGQELALIGSGSVIKSLTATSRQLTNQLNQDFPTLEIGEPVVYQQYRNHQQLRMLIFSPKPLTVQVKRFIRQLLLPSWYLDVEP